MRKYAAVILTVALLSHVMYVSAEMEGTTDTVLEKMTSSAEDGAEKIEAATVSGNSTSDISESSPENNKDEKTELEDSEGTDEDISRIDVEEEATEELAEAVLEKTETEQKERVNVIYNVSFPTNTKAFLDPGNLSGRGQVFSDRYTVENYGNTDIAIMIKDIDVRYRSEEEAYELTEEEITESHFNVKKMNIDMVWKNESEMEEKTLHVLDGESDQQVLILRAAEYNEDGVFVRLAEGGSGIFYFNGTLNSNPNIDWEEEEMVVRFNYEVCSLDGEQDGYGITEEEREETNAG